MSKKEKESGGFFLPFLIMGIASQAFGGGYDTVCVVSGQDKVACTSTTALSKFMSSAGMPNNLPDVDFSLQSNESPALLMCDDGDYYPIGVNPDNITKKEGEMTVYTVEDLPPCPVPKRPTSRKLWGPPDGRGGGFCNGRVSPDGCKDCCIGVGMAQAGMVAAAGKMFRDTKPPPRMMVADVVLELAAYGLIYFNQQECNSNCEVSYEH